MHTTTIYSAVFNPKNKFKALMNNSLVKPRKYQLTHDQDLAISKLVEKGYNRQKFVRLAIEEKLYRDYRAILKQIERENNKVYIPF